MFSYSSTLFSCASTKPKTDNKRNAPTRGTYVDSPRYFIHRALVTVFSIFNLLQELSVPTCQYYNIICGLVTVNTIHHGSHKTLDIC